MSARVILLASLVFAVLGPCGAADPSIAQLQGEIVGEVTDTAAILQSRLTGPAVVDGDLPGARGVARFEVSEDGEFAKSFKTPWMNAVPESDFMVKTRLTGLKPGTRYYYRLIYGPSQSENLTGQARTFLTNPGKASELGTSFVVLACMNYGHYRPAGWKPKTEAETDKLLGYPAL